jgi:hypothetical protein
LGLAGVVSAPSSVISSSRSNAMVT